MPKSPATKSKPQTASGAKAHGGTAAPRPVRQASGTEGLPVVYKDLEAFLLTGDNAITVEKAMEFLGWEEITKESGKDAVALFNDINGTPVRCNHIRNNRMFNLPDALKYSQDLLERNWADGRNGPYHGEEMSINGESIVVGRNGSVLSGQKRLAGLVFAEQRRVSAKERDHWEEKWDGPITMETVLVWGVVESPLVTRTIDNVQPRTHADNLYAKGAGFFPGRSPKSREKLGKIVAWGTKFLAERTGGDSDAYSKAWTNCMADNFLDAHPSLTKAAEHIYQEDTAFKIGDRKVGKISYFIPPGTAAGLLYLFGASATPYNDYHDRSVDNEGRIKGYREDVIKWDNWDKAVQFFTELAKASEKKGALAALRTAYRPLEEENYRPGTKGDDGKDIGGDSGMVFGGNGGSREERIGTLVKAWAVYLETGKLTHKDLETEPDLGVLRYIRTYDDATGLLAVATLDEFPVVEGIDKEHSVRLKGKPGDDETHNPNDEGAVIKAKQKKAKDNAKAAGVSGPTKGEVVVPPADETGHLGNGMLADLALLKGRHPGRLLVFKTKDSKECQLWGGDADEVAKVMGYKKFTSPTDKIPRVKFAAVHLDKVRDALLAAGKKVALLELDGDEKRVLAEWPAPKLATGMEPAPRSKPNGTGKPKAPAAKK